MKRIAAAGVVFLLLAMSYGAVAAESPGPGDRLTVNPIIVQPPPPPEAPGPLEAIGGYVWARVRDVGDILTLKLGWGTDKSIGFQARAIGPVQIGAGIFEGYLLAIDRGCVGIMKEGEVEFGVSVFYPSWIVRQVTWQTADAKRRNVFFNDVGKDGKLTPDAMKMYDDENQGWFVSTAQVQLPYLPKIELSIHWGEVFDLPLSFLAIPGLRVPPPFYKHPGPGGENPEMIPAPSIFWHGQEQFEKP